VAEDSLVDPRRPTSLRSHPYPELPPPIPNLCIHDTNLNGYISTGTYLPYKLRGTPDGASGTTH